ncbi:MAG: response regulator [Desulfobacterales bacterium]|nr:response regulator [Desulfobacterales bacterium]
MGASEKPLILIVDDNPQNLQFIGNLLSKNGYEPAVTMNGSQALDFLGHEKAELILLDIMMPEIDGYEVCKKIKANNALQDIPVIFLTAKTETDDLVKGFDAGAVDYVTKPFNSAELLARIKTHIELKRAREELKTLRGYIPICAKCKKIRDDEGFWSQIEQYIENHTEAMFSHGLCPGCTEELYGDQAWYKKMARKEPYESDA